MAIELNGFWVNSSFTTEPTQVMVSAHKEQGFIDRLLSE